MKPVLHRTVASRGATWYDYTQLGVRLFTTTITKGTMKQVYRHNPRTSLLDDTHDGFSMIKTITIVPPPGYVRIHNRSFADAGEWPGTWKVVGGIQPAGDVSFEAVRDSQVLCLSPIHRSFFDRYDLTSTYLEDGETYVFTESDVSAVVMKGQHLSTQGMFTSPNETYTAIGDTVLAVIKLKEQENV